VCSLSDLHKNAIDKLANGLTVHWYMTPIILSYGNSDILDPYYRPIFRNGETVIGSRRYMTVQIGDQEWLAENLDWVPNGITEQGSSTASVYVPSAWHYTDPDFDSGAFYNAQALSVLQFSLDQNSGWRVPTINDIEALCYHAKVDLQYNHYAPDAELTYERLLCLDYWTTNEGSDNYGLNLFPTGYRQFGTRIREGYCVATNLWTITQKLNDSSSEPDYYRITFNLPYNVSSIVLTASLDTVPSMNNGFNVRLVRNLDDVERQRPSTTKIGGRFYKTTVVGSQEWLAENLKLDDSGTGIYTKPSEPYSGEMYYDYDASVRVAALANGGWKLPDNDDFNALITALGGSTAALPRLKSPYGWSNDRNGDRLYGFSGFPVGMVTTGNGPDNVAGSAAFRSASVLDNQTYDMVLNASTVASVSSPRDKSWKSSVRLIRDYPSDVIGGRTYKTVRIGNQIWLAENLQLDDGGTGIITFNNGTGSYSNGEIIYQHTAARRVAASVGSGWRLPTNADIEELCSTTGVTLFFDDDGDAHGPSDPYYTYEVLLNTTDWPDENGSDLYGFNLLPVGFKNSINGRYYDNRSTTNFWSYEADGSIGYHFIINFGSSIPVARHGAYLAPWGGSSDYYSVRLVRDADTSGATIGDRTYNTVAIDGREWMAENLDWCPNGITDRGSGKWYTNRPMCAYYQNQRTEGYGRLYNWQAAQYLDTILTDGWRVPTKTDFLSLIAASRNGVALKSTHDWEHDANGTNEMLFNGLPGGMIVSNTSSGSTYTSWGYSGAFWSITPVGGNSDYVLNMNIRYDRDEIYMNGGVATHGLSIRLVRDC
jgi:uncharacterized protein (TIGR02145 family)